jgi:hypothetical protein
MGVFLTILNGSRKGSNILLKEGKTIIIGRDSDCDFFFEELAISKRHCTIFYENNDAIWLTDLESRNGTFVNGKKIKKSVIVSGDAVSFGSIHLQAMNTSQHEDTTASILEKTIDISEDFNIAYRKGKEEATFISELSTSNSLVFFHKIIKLLQQYDEIPALLNALLENLLIELNVNRGFIILRSARLQMASLSIFRSRIQYLENE